GGFVGPSLQGGRRAESPASTSPKRSPHPWGQSSRRRAHALKRHKACLPQASVGHPGASQGQGCAACEVCWSARGHESKRRTEGKLESELHFSNIPIHYKYTEIVAFGIGGEHKKPFEIGVIRLRRTNNLFSVEEGDFNSSSWLALLDFLRLF